MVRFVIKTSRLHICDIIDEMPFMAGRGIVNSLIKCSY